MVFEQFREMLSVHGIEVGEVQTKRQMKPLFSYNRVTNKFERISLQAGDKGEIIQEINLRDRVTGEVFIIRSGLVSDENKVTELQFFKKERELK